MSEQNGKIDKSRIDEDANRAEQITEKKRKAVQADYLVGIAEAVQWQVEVARKEASENLTDRRQTRQLRNAVSVIAIVVPLAILVILYWTIYHGIFMRLGDWAKVVFLSGSLIAFIAVYGFLLTGLFRRHSHNGGEKRRFVGKEENDSPETTQEMLAKSANTLSRLWGE
jgi:hypothetical protein